MREKEPEINLNATEGEDFERKKKAFFNDFAQEHIPEMRLLFRGGKLWEKEDWRNVVEHSLVVAAATCEISDMLGLPEDEKEKLIKAAFCHDWDKRIKRKPEDFDNEEKTKARDFLMAVKPEKELIEATTRGFVGKFHESQPNLLQKVAHYVDAIVLESQISPFKERLKKAAPKYGDLDANFWKNNIQITDEIEKEIFEILKERGVNVDSPEEIPNMISEKIKEKILNK